MLCKRFGLRDVEVQLERDDKLRKALVEGVVSGGVACVHGARWADDGSETDLSSAEEAYCEGELERAAAAVVARDAARLAELVPARRVA